MAREKGVEIITDAEIAEVRVERGQRDRGRHARRARPTRRRRSSPTSRPRSSTSTCVAEGQLPDDSMREIRGYRTFSTAFKINIACERPPQYAILDKLRATASSAASTTRPTSISRRTSTISSAPTTTPSTAAISARPFITPVVPTFVDDTLAPPGKHVVNLFGGHAPYELKGADWASAKDAFRKTMLDTIEEVAPGFSSDIIDEQLLVAARYREDRQPAAGPHLPRRALARPAVLPAPRIAAMPTTARR